MVTGLVLCDTEIPGVHPELIPRLQTAMKVPGAKAASRALLRQPKAARSPQLLGGLFFDTDLIEGDFRDAVLTKTLGSAAAFDRQIEILLGYQPELVDGLSDVHARITCPTLLVWGEHDGFFPVGEARKMASQFGGPVSFEVIPEARLLSYEEHPERFAELTRTFLRSR